MQKHLQKLLLIVAMMLVPWVANAQDAFSYSCNFDGDSDTAGWVFVNGSQQNQWFIGTAAHNSGTKGLYISNDNGTSNSYSGSNTFVYAYQEFTLDSGGYAISYDWRCQGEGNYDYIRVFLAPATVTLPAGASPNNTTTSAYTWGSETLPAGCISLTGSNMKLNLQSSWQNVLSEIYVPTSGTWRLVFAWANDGSVQNTPAGGIDNIVFMQPTCPRPSDMVFSNITQNSFDVSWTETGSATEWLVWVDSVGITVDSIIAYDTTVSFTDRAANTPYTVRVAALCGGIDTSMMLVSNFRTPCNFISALPFIHTFESDPTSSSTTGSAFVNCWTRLNNGTSYGGYPYVSSSSSYNHTPGGTKGLYWYNSTTMGSYGDYQCVVLPGIDTDLFATNTLQLSFWARSSSTSYYPIFYVGVLTNPNDINTFTPVDTINVGNSTTFSEFVTSFENYTGFGNYIAVKAVRPSSSWYAYVDDFKLEQLPDCPRVEDVTVTGVTTTDATITWTEQGTAYSWTIEYGPTGFSLGDSIASTLTASDTSITLIGLDPNTAYDVYITVDCPDGVGGVNMVSFRTLCGYLDSLPFVETFESQPSSSSTTGSPFINCWSRLNNGTSYGGYPYVSNSTTYNHTPSGSRGLYWYNTTTTGTYGDYQCIVLPGVDTDTYPINTLQLRFWARSSSTSYHPVFIVGVMSDPNDISTFTEVQSVYVSNSTVWEEFIADLSSHTGSGSYVAIRANRPSSSWYCYVDDITLRTIPVCPDVNDLTVAQVSPASAFVTWQTLGGLSEPVSYEVVYDSVNSTSTPITLTVTDPYVTITSLTPSTSYKIKVRANCGVEDGMWDSTTFATMALSCFELDPATADTVNFTNSTSGISGCLAYSSWGNTAYQTIYTAAELTAAGLTAGGITGIDLGFTPSTSYNKELTIFLGNTTTTSISNATLEDPNAHLQVYGPASHPMNTSGWQHYDFDTPFMWDGASSIILTTFMNQPSGVSQSSSSGLTGYYVSASNKARYRYKDSNPFTLSDYNSGSAGGTYSYRASIHFYKGDCMVAATCAEPIAQATRNDANEVDLVWAPGYQETSWDVDYRQGTTGVWVNALTGTTATNYTFTGLMPNTQYQFRVTANCGDTTMSSVLTLKTPCSAMNMLPYTETFETSNTGSSSTSSAFIDCWHRLNNGTSYGGYPYVSSSSTYNHTAGGTKGLYWYNSTTTGSYGDYQCIVLPPVDSAVYQANNLQLTFWAKSSSTSYYPVFIVGVLTDPDDITTFVGVDTINVGGNTNWTEFEVPLNNYTGNGTYVALRANRPTSTWYAYVDDITLDVIPACPHINDLSQTDATLSTITLHWEEIGEATQWTIEYDTVDFIPGNNMADNIVTASDTTYIITGLDSNTSYYIYVAADCGGGETSPYRSIVGRTLAAAPAELPYSCNFEAEGNNGWDLLNGTQTNGWYVDSAANNGGSRSLYISNDGGASNSYTNSTISYAYAIRAINFADSGEFAYSYDWRGQGESHYYDFTRVFLAPYGYQWEENTNPAGSTYNFSQWTCPDSWIELTENFSTPRTMSNSTTWRTVVGTFRLNTPGVYNLVFAWANDGSVGSNPPTAIDNVSMVQNTCPAPIVELDSTTLDSIMIHWQPGGDESTWMVVCDTIMDIVFDTFYTFDNLSPSTPYTVYVYALCDEGDTSLPGTVLARTQCGRITSLPFGDNFNSLSYNNNDRAPECWFGYNNYDSYYPSVDEYTDRYNSGFSLYTYMYGSGTYTIIQLPPVDTNVLPIRTLQLEFSLQSSYGTGAAIVGVCTGQGLVNFTPLDTVFVNEDYNWHDFEVPLTNYSDTGSYISLVMYAPGGDLDLYIDEVHLVAAPTCVRPRNIRATTVTTTDALVRWAPADSAQTDFEIRYGIAGCNVDTLTGITVSGADSLLITGLDSGVVYSVFVRAICGAGDTSFWTSGTFRTLASSPISSFPYICDFTSPEGLAWNLENGTETNKWYVGTAAYNGTADSMGLYVSDNNGVSNSYNNTAVSFSYAYRTFNMPAGQYAYSFDWRAQGESQYYDFIRVFLAPASDEITAGQSPNGNTSSYSFGSELPREGWIDLSMVTTAPYTLNQHSAWTNVNSIFNLTTGGTYNLVFAWSNDGSGGSNPAGAIDNVQIYRNTCPSPVNFRVTGNTTSSITVAWDTVGTPTGYELSYGTTTGSPSVDTTVTSSPVTFSGLTPGQTYYFYIRTNCDSGSDSSMWVGPISAVPGTWNMRPNQTDTLYMCGGVIYDDAGTSSYYSNSQNSYIILYPDAPNNLVSVSGNYNLESCCDYVKIYDGNSVTSTQLFSSQNTSSGTIGPLISTNGPLTIYFHTDVSVNSYAGFTLNVSCISTTCRVFNVRLDTAYAQSDSQLAITWDTNGADYYEVEYGTPGFIPTGSGSTITYTNSIIIPGLTGLTNYDVCVRSICNMGADTGSWSRETFQTAMCDNLTEIFDYDSTMTSTTSSYGPIGYATYNYSYVQTLIDSAQMAGLTDPISAFAFHPNNTTSSTYYTHMTVYMANVPETSLSNMITPDSNHVFVPVITDATFNFTDVGWQVHGFDTTFTWDGHSNVLFAVNRQHGSWSSSTSFAAHSTSSTRTRYLYQDSGPISITSPSASSSGSGSYVGDLKFFSCGAAGCRQPIITGVTQTYESATITWTGEGTEYEVNVKEAVATDWPATDIHVTGNTYTFTGLQPATNYTFRVRQDCTADSLDYSAWSISGFTTDSLPCLTPDSLTVTAVTNATATLDWNPRGYENMWEIHVWTSGGVDSVYTVTSHPATVGGFTANTSYNASVRPLCGTLGNIEGEWGDTIVFNTAVCPDVTGLGTRNVTANSVDVYWNPDPMAQQWIIEYGFHGFDLGTGTQVTTTLTTYTINGLMDDMEYDFRVRAVCGDDWQSEGWATTSATTLEGGVPCDAPTAVNAVAAGNAVTVSWTANTGNLSFVLEYGTRGFALGSGTTVSATASPVTISNLAYETAYDVYVKANCADNTSSAWSAVASFTTEAQGSEDCDPVTDLAASNVTESAALLTWTPGNSGDEWEVVLTTAAGATVSENSTTERQFQLNGLTPGTAYVAKVRTVCGDGQYSDFASVSFTTNSVGIADVTAPACTIYPNPTSGATTVSVSGISGKVRIAIVDMNGREVTSETLDCSGDCAKTMSVDNLAQGAYFVRITGENANMVRKLIVR